jgi:TRAP-type C4-dicarboxylate transport system substrate-binding protein
MCLALSLVATVALCTVLGVTPAIAKKVNLKFAHSEAVANIRHDAALHFAKQVSDLSKGEISVEVFPAGVMGTHQSCQEQVAMGTLDFYPTTAGLVSVFDPTGPKSSSNCPISSTPMHRLTPSWTRLCEQVL